MRIRHDLAVFSHQRAIEDAGGRDQQLVGRIAAGMIAAVGPTPLRFADRGAGATRRSLSRPYPRHAGEFRGAGLAAGPAVRATSPKYACRAESPQDFPGLTCHRLQRIAIFSATEPPSKPRTPRPLGCPAAWAQPKGRPERPLQAGGPAPRRTSRL